jgi:hypothetical protein
VGCEGSAVQSSGERSSEVCIGTFSGSELLSGYSLCMMLVWNAICRCSCVEQERGHMHTDGVSMQ